MGPVIPSLVMNNDAVNTSTELDTLASANDRSFPSPTETTSSAKARVFSQFVEESSEEQKKKKLPSVFQYTDYREYLSEFFVVKKELSPAYSASAFVRRAGLGANSRGYLKLVIDGKRNLTPATVRAFSEALGLTSQESLYFENLVHFNQSEKAQDRKYYFERLLVASQGVRSKKLLILESQYQLMNHWYVMAIRELIAIDQFIEDPSWIVRALKGGLSTQEVELALHALMSLGLIERDPQTRKLKQNEGLMELLPKEFSPFLVNFHLGMIERAKEAIRDDDFSLRTAMGITLSCPKEKMSEIKKMIDEFSAQLLEKFGTLPTGIDSVIQVNFQAFHLTNPRIHQNRKEPKNV